MKILKLSLLTFLLPVTAFPQAGLQHSSARNLSMTGSAGVSLSGWEAAGLNPAATGQPGKSKLSIGVISSGAMVVNTGLSFQFYQDYFTGEMVNGKLKPLNLDVKNRKADFISQFDGDETGSAAGTVTPFAVSFEWPSVGSFSLLYSLKAEGRATIPQDLFRFMMNGAETGSSYNLDDSHLEAILRAEWALTYSRSLKGYLPAIEKVLSSPAAGASLKLEQGITYANLETKKNTFSVDADRVQHHQFDYSILMAGNDVWGNWFRSEELIKTHDDWFMSPAGTGVGFDFGLSGNLFGVIPVFASVTDLGWITWEQNAQKISGKGTITYTPRERDADTTTLAMFEQDSLKGQYTPVKKKTTFTTYLPASLNIGASVNSKAVPFLKNLYIPGDLVFFGAYQQGLNETPGNSFIPRISVGGDWKLFDLWHVRTGFSGGGEELFSWGLGTGIESRYVLFDIGTANFHHLFSGLDARRLSVAMTLQFLIP